MPTIAVIDDRQEQRDTVVKTIKRKLGENENWNVDDIAPLEDISQYTSWIAENSISVLLLDERLHEGAPPNALSVKYNGHNVVDAVRRNFVTLPIWIITSYDIDEDLKARFPDVEGVVNRLDFSRASEVYVARFVRTGSKFYDDNKNQLERISDISRKIAYGTATDIEKEELGGLQISQILPVSSLIANSEWVEDLEVLTAELDELAERIQKYIEGS